MLRLIIHIFLLLILIPSISSQNDVLVIDYNTGFTVFSDEISNNSRIFDRLNTTQTSVTRINAIPPTIDPAVYDQVWIFGFIGTTSAATLDPVVDYMNSGGAVYVQSGEKRTCCDMAEYVDSLINLTVSFGSSIIHRDTNARVGTYSSSFNSGLGCSPSNPIGAAARLFAGVPSDNQLVKVISVCPNPPLNGPTPRTALEVGDVIGVKFRSCDMISGNGALITLGDFNLFPTNPNPCSVPSPGSPNDIGLIDSIAVLLPRLLDCTIGINTASFNYSSNTYCLLDTNPTPIITGVQGGSFTINNGGVIDPNTGEINLINSDAGEFTITYTYGCGNDTVTSNISIIGSSASFDYDSDTYCLTDLNPLPTITGDQGGVFTINNNGVIDSNTGEINLLNTNTGNYVITYAYGTCGYSANDTIDIINFSASLSYPFEEYCLSDVNPIPEVVGTQGGFFTIDGEGVIDFNTGEVNLSASNPNTYIVTYSNGICSSTATTNIEIQNCSPVILVPNAFTPDGNNLNETFSPSVLNVSNQGFSFNVYNRWGENIFQSNQIIDGWDGTYKNKLVPNGVYLWKMGFNDENNISHEKMGKVVLIR